MTDSDLVFRMISNPSDVSGGNYVREVYMRLQTFFLAFFLAQVAFRL